MSSLLLQASQYLQKSSGRMTGQRRLILAVMDSLSGHPTADEIYQAARCQDPTLNISTVYRTLHWLQEIELVSPRWFSEKRRQERFDPATAVDHHHFRCKVCGQIIEFSNPAIDAVCSKFVDTFGGQVNEASLVLYGICQQCLLQSN